MTIKQRALVSLLHIPQSTMHEIKKITSRRSDITIDRSGANLDSEIGGGASTFSGVKK